MRKIIYNLLLLLFITQYSVAQTGASASNMLKDEQQKFIYHLKGISIDSVTVYPLARYFDSQINSIYNSIMSDNSLTELEKEKAVRSLVYFITQLSNNMVQRKFDVYNIPDALQSYTEIMRALTHHQPFTRLAQATEVESSQVIASAFSQYEEYTSLDEISVYKRIADTPEFILQFLNAKPNFRFADSLLIQAAANNPAKLVYYLNNGNQGLQQLIRSSKNKYVKQIIALSGDKNATELYPFVLQIADGKMDAQQIMSQRPAVTQYFQMMVNTLKESRMSKDSSSIFLKLLRNGVRQKALAFYVNQINERHNSPDAVRFASVKKLRPEDYYYIMTSCGDELYTSSYIGLYKRLVDQFKEADVDSLFEIVHYDNFSLFLRLAANYNVAVDFLHRMSVQGMEYAAHRFIGNIEKTPDAALDKAMDVADFFSGLNTDADINGLVESELKANLNRCTGKQNYLGMKLYSTLIRVFALVKEGKGMNKLWNTLGNYEVLKHDSLVKNNAITELVLFYGDEDGKASYNSFLKSYTDANKWAITKMPNWINIRSKTDQPIDIYANLPLDGEQELDIKAQDSLIDFLNLQPLQPVVLVHRGHSYHLDKTLKRLTPFVKLAVLGSCGGYNHAISIASISPDVQVIGSKKTGTMSINDPLIDAINETLLQGKDLVWSEIWADLSARFSKDAMSSAMFSEYFSPDNNLSLFVLKLFNM